MNHSYGRHPSWELNDIFQKQEFPHQGQHPNKSQIVIVGLDANYSPDISAHLDFMRLIFEYHQDGAKFWEKYNIHHPFLHRSYPFDKRKGGVPYHRKFTWLGLDGSFSDKLAFIELIPFPTTGNTENGEYWRLFDLAHARKIDTLIQRREKRIILLSKTLVKNYMIPAKEAHDVFGWLPNEFHLGEMAWVGSTLIYGAPHFSSTTYKKEVFENVGRDVRKFCAN